MNYRIVPPIVIRYEDGDELVHTQDHPFCGDETCPCMEALYDLVEAEIEIEIERQEQETTGTHAPNCRCAWCEPEVL